VCARGIASIKYLSASRSWCLAPQAAVRRRLFLTLRLPRSFHPRGRISPPIARSECLSMAAVEPARQCARFRLCIDSPREPQVNRSAPHQPKPPCQRSHKKQSTRYAAIPATVPMRHPISPTQTHSQPQELFTGLLLQLHHLSSDQQDFRKSCSSSLSVALLSVQFSLCCCSGT